MKQHLLLAIAFAGAMGCSDSFDLETDTATLPPEFNDDLRIDVHPPTDNLAMTAPVLPATFWEDSDQFSSRDPQEIDLLLPEPVTVSGTITGWETTPLLSADLPGMDAPLKAEVQIRKAGTVQSRATLCDEEGHFSFQVVPGEDYEVTVLSGHPLIPFHTEHVSITDDLTFDLQLGYGEAIWGWVYDNSGATIADAEVHAENSFGVAGTSTVTDNNGFYMLRVLPGSFRIVTSGRSHGRDPVMVSEQVVVDVEDDALGRQLDLTYPNLELVTISGRAVDNLKEGLEDIRVRLTAQRIEGYDELASFAVELATNRPGNFDTRVVPGEYTLELLPATDANLTPAAISGLVVTTDLDLGELVMPAMEPFTGWVTDEQGNPIANTIVTAQEIGYGTRSWTTSSNEMGSFLVTLPQVPVKISLMPTPDESGLAFTTSRFDPTTDEDLELTVRRGHSIYGTLRTETEDSTATIPYGLIEFYSATDVLLGASLTSTDGSYSMSILSDLEL